MNKLEIFDCEQGSDEWFKCRMGIPTASRFSHVLAQGEGKMRGKYMRQLATEIITGDPQETYKNANMERGNAMEAEARELYAFAMDAKLTRIGFGKRGRMGASPDSLVGDDGGVEIKTMIGENLIELLERKSPDPPPEYTPQLQGNMAVFGRKWWDLVVYWPRMPLYRKRVLRNDAYIEHRLGGEIMLFNRDLDRMVERLTDKRGMRKDDDEIPL